MEFPIFRFSIVSETNMFSSDFRSLRRPIDRRRTRPAAEASQGRSWAVSIGSVFWSWFLPSYFRWCQTENWKFCDVTVVTSLVMYNLSMFLNIWVGIAQILTKTGWFTNLKKHHLGLGERWINLAAAAAGSIGPDHLTYSQHIVRACILAWFSSWSGGFVQINHSKWPC